MTRARLDRVLAALFVAVLFATDAFAPALFLTLAATAAFLLVLYAVTAPALVVRLVRALRADRRLAASLLAALVVLGAVDHAGDRLRHPAVDAAQLQADWVSANAALAHVMADDVRSLTVTGDARIALLRDMRAAARDFADAVDLLARVRPPEDAIRTQRAVVVVYARIAVLVADLPNALARGDTSRATGIVRRIGTLTDEASAQVQLATPP